MAKLHRGRALGGWRSVVLAGMALVLAGACAGTATESDNTSAIDTPVVAPPEPADTTPAPASAEAPPETTTTEKPSSLVPGRLAGNGPQPSGGEPGTVSVALQGAYRQPHEKFGASLPLIVRNNTSRPIIRPTITAVALDGGAEVARGTDGGFQPQIVGPGAFAIGFVTFDSRPTLSPNARFQIDVGYSKEGEISVIRHDLEVAQVNVGNGSLSGVARNPHGTALNTLEMNIACFRADGSLSHVQYGSFPSPNVAAGGSADFTANVADPPCPRYLVGATGYSR